MISFTLSSLSIKGTHSSGWETPCKPIMTMTTCTLSAGNFHLRALCEACQVVKTAWKEGVVGRGGMCIQVSRQPLIDNLIKLVPLEMSTFLQHGESPGN